MASESLDATSEEIFAALRASADPIETIAAKAPAKEVHIPQSATSPNVVVTRGQKEQKQQKSKVFDYTAVSSGRRTLLWEVTEPDGKIWYRTVVVIGKKKFSNDSSDHPGCMAGAATALGKTVDLPTKKEE